MSGGLMVRSVAGFAAGGNLKISQFSAERQMQQRLLQRPQCGELPLVRPREAVGCGGVHKEILPDSTAIGTGAASALSTNAFPIIIL